jgi:hypothetical protein
VINKNKETKNERKQKPATHLESVVEGALSRRFEGSWQASRGIYSKYSYHPDYCQKLKDFILKCVKISETPLSLPPHLSEFARSIGIPTKVIEDWANVFPELKEEIETLNDLGKEMLINGGLLETYNTKITTILLDHNYGIREKKESIIPEGVALIPMSAVQSVQFLIQQQGLPPVKLTDLQE